MATSFRKQHTHRSCCNLIGNRAGNYGSDRANARKIPSAKDGNSSSDFADDHADHHRWCRIVLFLQQSDHWVGPNAFGDHPCPYHPWCTFRRDHCKCDSGGIQSNVLEGGSELRGKRVHAISTNSATTHIARRRYRRVVRFRGFVRRTRSRAVYGRCRATDNSSANVERYSRGIESDYPCRRYVANSVCSLLPVCGRMAEVAQFTDRNTRKLKQFNSSLGEILQVGSTRNSFDFKECFSYS